MHTVVAIQHGATRVAGARAKGRDEWGVAESAGVTRYCGPTRQFDLAHFDDVPGQCNRSLTPRTRVGRDSVRSSAAAFRIWPEAR